MPIWPVALDIRVTFDGAVTINRRIALGFRIGIERSVAGRFEGAVDFRIFQAGVAADGEVLGDGCIAFHGDIAFEIRCTIDDAVAFRFSISVDREVFTDRDVSTGCDVACESRGAIDSLIALIWESLSIV